MSKYYLRDFCHEADSNDIDYDYGVEIGKALPHLSHPTPSNNYDDNGDDYDITSYHDSIDECLDTLRERHNLLPESGYGDLLNHLKIDQNSLGTKDVAYLSSKVEESTGKKPELKDMYYIEDTHALGSTSEKGVFYIKVGKVTDATPEPGTHGSSITISKPYQRFEYYDNINDCVKSLENHHDNVCNGSLDKAINSIESDGSLTTKEVVELEHCKEVQIEANKHRGMYFVYDYEDDNNAAENRTIIGKVVDGEPYEIDNDGVSTSHQVHHYENLDAAFNGVPKRALGRLETDGLSDIENVYVKELTQQKLDAVKAIENTKDNRQFDGDLDGDTIPVTSHSAESAAKTQAVLAAKQEISQPTHVNLDVKNVTERYTINNGKSNAFYTGYVDVPESVSENKKAYITFDKNQVNGEQPNTNHSSCSVNLPSDSARNMRVKENGEYVTKSITGSELGNLQKAAHKEYDNMVASVESKGAQISETEQSADIKKGPTK